MKKMLIFLALIVICSGANVYNCPQPLKKVGCFADDIFPNRTLPLEILNRRDPRNHHFDGILINWKKWGETLQSLACRCAELCKAKGYTHFGLQFYGECWSGPNAASLFARDGGSGRCIGYGYKPCDDSSSTECIGRDATNYVYTVATSEPKDKVKKDGGYTVWSGWTGCTKTCGGGYKSRERSCTNPTPVNGGTDCTDLGDPEETVECNKNACPPVCKRAIELGVIMDASSSVTRPNYLKMKNFVIALSNEFQISPVGTHMGMIHYSYRARLDFRMSNTMYYDRMKLQAKIGSIIYSFGGTRTDKALRVAERDLFCQDCGVRSNIPHVLLVITDGNTNPGSETMTDATANLKKNGVTIIALGIGKAIDYSELAEIASPSTASSKHVFMIDKFANINTKLQDILAGACQATLLS